MTFSFRRRLRLLVVAALLVLNASFAAAQCKLFSTQNAMTDFVIDTYKIPGIMFDEDGSPYDVINTYTFR